MKSYIPVGLMAFALIAVLFSENGAAQVRVSEVAKEHRSVAPKTIEWQMDVPPFSIEHQVRLSLECRIDWPKLAGSNPWIQVYVNDNVITEADLLNKPNEFQTRGGVDLLWFNRGNRWRVLYSPDFQTAVKRQDLPYAVPPEADPYRYVWDVTRHVHPGKNRLRIVHLQVLPKPTTLVLRNVRVEVGKPIEAPRAMEVAPAPTGPLPTFVAKGPQKLSLEVKASGRGLIEVGVAAQRYRVTTRISLPGGRWHESGMEAAKPLAGKTAGFSWQAGSCHVERTITIRDDHIAVADKLTNAGEAALGLIVEHHLRGKGPPTEVLLGGMPAFGERGTRRDSANPSAFGLYEEGGVGLVAEDDTLRVHVRAFRSAAAFGIADDRLCLEPGKSVTLEWSIYPVPGGDYWDFVNAVRRNWDTNFTIPGPFVFASHRGGRPAEWYADWCRKRDVKIVVGGIAKYPNGKYAHGTGICFAPDWVADQKDWTRKLRSAEPDVIPMAYFHAQVSTEPDSKVKYADCRLLDARGDQVEYPYRYSLPIFVPTAENSYGKALRRVLDTLIEEIGVAGIYWDEMSYSVQTYAYDAPWDGCSAMINPRTHEIERKISSVPLLMQPLKIEMIRRLRERGMLLIGNGQPHTRTMLRQKVIRFVETGTYSHLAKAHLGSPIGLGNHHAEDTQAASARHVRDILMRGCVYYGHYYWRDPASWNFTSVMYPITPVEIREGMVLGKERILTAVSGRFGWPDGAAAEVYVVDGDGARVKDPQVTEVVEEGRRLYEIRMPGDHFAVLVKSSGR